MLFWIEDETKEAKKQKNKTAKRIMTTREINKEIVKSVQSKEN